MNNIGELIRKYRRERGMSQEELAQKVGYTSGRSMISQIESGKVDLPLSKAMDFADAFHVSIYELLGVNFDPGDEMPPDVAGVSALLALDGLTIKRRYGKYSIFTNDGYTLVSDEDIVAIVSAARTAAKNAALLAYYKTVNTEIINIGPFEE